MVVITNGVSKINTLYSFMKTIILQSSKLPELGISSKKMINSGYWILYSVAPARGNRSIKYILRTNDEVYLLNEVGAILKIIKVGRINIRGGKFVYFSDVEREKIESRFHVSL